MDIVRRSRMEQVREALSLHRKVATSSARTIEAGERSLAATGRFSLRGVLPFLGPAFIAAIAYIDPGNFATNMQAGAQYGYLLLWVILASNLMAVLLQMLSAKVGIATGKNLPELCRDHLPRPVSVGLWIVAEIGAMATDLAEFLGAAIGFNLLFHIPLLLAGILTGITTFAILGFQRFGFRPLEAIIAALLGVIAVSYLVETFLARPDGGQIAFHSLVPQFDGPGSVLLAVGILGATVMPHVVYLHSALTQNRIQPRNDGEKLRILRFERVDIIIALGLAGLVNGAMLFMAASVFFAGGHHEVGSLDSAFHTLRPLLGDASSIIFGVALLASGLSSSTVGTLAGQVIMEGFLGWKIPTWLRRGLTMLPALVFIALNVNPDQTLVISQVVLSFVLPFAIVPLLIFTGRKQVMGALVNRRVTQVAGWAVATIILGLNIFLIAQTLGIGGLH